jgi:hypothetical protein
MSKPINANEVFKIVSRSVLGAYKKTTEQAVEQIDQAGSAPSNRGAITADIASHLVRHLKRACRAAKIGFPPSPAEFDLLAAAAFASIYLVDRGPGHPKTWTATAVRELADDVERVRKAHPHWTARTACRHLLKTEPYASMTGRRGAQLDAGTLARRLPAKTRRPRSRSLRVS